MKQRETRSLRAAQLECRKLPDGTLQVSGYAIRFNEPSAMLDGFTEVCSPQMLTRTLKENPDVLLLRDHDSSKLLARTKPGTLQLTVDGQGLRFVANMQPTDIAADTWQNLKAGNLDGCSFGFRCVDENWSTTADGTPLRTLLDVDLFEISIVSWPAYPTTSAEARSRAAQMKRDDWTDPDPYSDDDTDDPEDALTGAYQGSFDADDEDEDGDDDEVCSCSCRSCRQLRDCANCYSVRCEDRSCRSNSCPMQDEQRADALRVRLLYQSRHRLNTSNT